MRDRTTPRLTKGEQPSAILSGHEFLADRETELQARLDELEGELASLEEAPDDVQSLEEQVADGLRAVMDALEPSAKALTTYRPTPPPEPEPTQPPAAKALTTYPASRPGARTGTWRRFAAVAALLLALAGAIAVFLLYGLPLVTEITREEPTATTVVLSTATNTPAPAITASPTRPPVTSTPLPSPTIVAPVIPDSPGQAGATVRAETLQIEDVSGTLRLELPLVVMTETVRLVEGTPVLKPVLPSNGAGLHRGSALFGKDGVTIIAVSGTTAPASLWQTRPGDRLTGCNSDGACHDYQVVIAETWDLDRVHQILRDMSLMPWQWPPDRGVLLYVVLDETDAWVVQAQPREGETR